MLWLAALGRITDGISSGSVKPGSLTIKLTIKPEKGGGSQKTISCKLAAAKPEEDLPEAIFFSDEEGTLHRNDPDQREMFSDAERGDRLDHNGPRAQARA